MNKNKLENKNLLFMNYIGNKFKNIDIINNQIDKAIKLIKEENNILDNEISFIEPFCGSANISLNNTYKFKDIFAYDINKKILNIFKTFSNISYKELKKVHASIYIESSKFKTMTIDEIKQYNNDLKNLLNSENLDFNTYNIIFYYLIKKSFLGLTKFNKKGEFNSTLHTDRNVMKLMSEENFNEIKKRLNRINFDYKSFLDIDDATINNKNLVWFIDPPYINSFKSVGYTLDKNFSSEIILEFIKQIKGKVIYTNIKHPLCDSYLKNWNSYKIRDMWKLSQFRGKRKKDKEEMLYTNF